MHQWQRFHFIDELQRAGHTLTIFNPLSYRSIEEANELLPFFIKEAKRKFDVFINPSPSSLLFKNTIQKIFEGNTKLIIKSIHSKSFFFNQQNVKSPKPC